LSENLVGQARDKVLADREIILTEVHDTVERLQVTVNQFHELVRTDQKVDLAAMREELEATMRIAQRTEQRMRELEQTSSRYEKFNQE
jgi:RNA polymerase-binding transcription factor DksA